MMNRQLLQDGLVWGFALWLLGYLLSILLFMLVPKPLIGWIIMPIGTAAALGVLLKKVKGSSFDSFLMLALIWTVVAVLFDYLFLVKLFKPEDGYYKLDVYLYYLFTFILPLLVGWRKSQIKK